MRINQAKVASIFGLLWLILLAAGCSSIDALDSGDLKDVELVTSLAVDKSEGSSQLVATVQLLNRDKALDRQYAESYYNLTAEGINLPAAVGELYRYGARQLNFSHASILLLSEQTADCQHWLDYALRSPELRPTIYPGVCQDNAGRLLAAEVEKISQTYLLNNILEPLGSGRPGATAITLQSFVEDLLQPGIEPVLPWVEQSQQGVELGGLMVFNGVGQPVAVLPEDACWGYIWLARPQHLRGYTLELPQAVVFQVENAVVKVETAALAEGCASVQFKLRLRARLLNNPAILSEKELQKITEDRLQQFLNAALAESRRLQLDFLGLGRELYRHQPQLWEGLQDQAYLEKLTVSLSVETEILQS